MCDTLFTKRGGISILMKNSDRAANEPSLVIYAPARKAQKELKCTYITIADEDSFESILIKPSWIWGAEMGVNSKGVCIGNEAVFTKSKDKKRKSLIGMDYLRLALERGENALKAAQVIINLLQKYGQGGNCGFDHDFYYDNSYLIADSNEAFILETAGKDYALKRAGVSANISNRLSINLDYDKSSIKTDFAAQFSDKIYTVLSGSAQRKELGARYLEAMDGQDLTQCFAALRAHYGESEKKLFRGGSVRSVCMHAGLLGDQTTGSMVAVLRKDVYTIWVTGSSTPCISVFKPIYLSPNCTAPLFLNQNESAKYWLKRERLNRAIFAGLVDTTEHKNMISNLENDFITEQERLLERGVGLDRLVEFSADCAKREQQLIDSYDTTVEKYFNDRLLPLHWRKRQARLGKDIF